MGAPSIDGGMTEEQYAKLQQEERSWQKELQDENYARAQAAEEKRLAMEQANEEKLEAQKSAEENAIQSAQLELDDELDAQADAADDFGAIDFYGALSQGQSSSTEPRPE